MKKILLAISLCLCFVYAQAQQNAQFSQFMWAKLAYNPAYAGSSDHLSVTALHRSQWVGLEGAPTTQNVNAHSSVFRKRVGVGLNIMRDNITISNNWKIGMSYAYRIKVNQGVISLGLEGAVKYINTDWNMAEAVEKTDEAIPTYEGQKFFPDVGIGAYYQKENFYAGLSVQNLIKAFVKLDEGEIMDVIRTDRNHTYLMTGGVVDLSDNIKLNPVFMMTYVRNTPIDLDLHTSLIFMEKFWFGMSYRKGDSVDAIIQYQINKQIRLGLAYDFTLSELQKVSNGTYEMLLKYDFQYDKSKRVNIRFF